MPDSKQATFRFYKELNDFLPPTRRDQPFTHRFEGTVSVKDMIESLGVPHPEVSIILANGRSVSFAYLVQDGDDLAVHPHFSDLDVAEEERAAPTPLPEPRFVLDTHLGRLASHLRMLGFDTLYRNDYADDELARVSHEEQRILLTRDLGLLKRSLVLHGTFVRHTQPEQQVVEVLRRLGIREWVRPFTRCTRCNGLLTVVEKATIAERLSEETRRHYDEFRLCQSCEQIYWRGSHFQRLENFLAEVMKGVEG